MTDPEEQLRRVAEHRAERVGAHVPDLAHPPTGGNSRRSMWWLAAAVVVMAAGIGTAVQWSGDDGFDSDKADLRVDDLPSSTTTTTTAIVTGTTSTPPPTTTSGPLDAAFLDPACTAEEPWASGDLDGDDIGDRIVQTGRRVIDEPEGITAIDAVVCRGTGEVHPWEVDGRWQSAWLLDLDHDGGDEVVLFDAVHAPFVANVFVFVDGADPVVQPLVAGGAVLDLFYSFDGLNDDPDYFADNDRWFGCSDLDGWGEQRLVAGTFSHDIGRETVSWELSEVLWTGSDATFGPLITGSFALSDAESQNADYAMPGRWFCKEDPSPCDAADTLVGDLDGDGADDRISVEAEWVCLATGPAAKFDVGDIVPEAQWLGDIEGDGRMELWVGGTTAYSVIVSPWSVDADGSVRPVETTPGCCQQYLPGTDLPDQTWFSCADGIVVTGTFSTDEESGLVRWTIDQDGGEDVEYEATFDDPLAIGALIPGNQCQGAPWTGSLDQTDWVVDESSIDALNEWIGDRELIGEMLAFRPVRDALDVAETLRSASGPYRESAEEGWIEIHGLHDDSTGALRYDIELSADGNRVEGIAQTWSCQPGRGHADFSTERCL